MIIYQALDAKPPGYVSALLFPCNNTRTLRCTLVYCNVIGSAIEQSPKCRPGFSVTRSDLSVCWDFRQTQIRQPFRVFVYDAETVERRVDVLSSDIAWLVLEAPSARSVSHYSNLLNRAFVPTPAERCSDVAPALFRQVGGERIEKKVSVLPEASLTGTHGSTSASRRAIRFFGIRLHAQSKK